jgi:hypothetical protein
VERRCRGKPHTGFPPQLGSEADPLSHRLDDDQSSLSQTKGEEGSMKSRPDNSRVIKTGQLQKLTTGTLPRSSELLRKPSSWQAWSCGLKLTLILLVCGVLAASLAVK